MASQSGNPTTATENTQNSATGHEQPQKEVHQDEKAEVDKQTTKTSVYVNSEPMREEQVQNAVKFLSHPKVGGSPVIYRRSFLEKKGLTKEEIDEAFRLVPDPPPTAVAANVSQDGLVNSPSNNQPQASMQTLQPAPAAPTGVVSSSGTLKQSTFHWSHVILAIGLLSMSGVGTTLIIKNKIIPRLKSWICKVVKDEDEEHVKRENSKPSLEEEAAAAAKAAAEAAVDVAKASQEMLNSKYEERKNFEEFVSLLNAQLQEMKSLTTAIQSLEGQRNGPGRIPVAEQEDRGVNVTVPKQLPANGKMDHDFSAAISSSLPMSVEPSIMPHPNSYMEPWGVRQVPNNSNPIHESQRSGGSFYSTTQDNGPNYQLNGHSSVPWWQQHNVRITEMDNEDNLKAGSSVGYLSEQPIKRAWVPPQPPPVVMPEAAEAIRRPKSSVQTESLADNQLVTPLDMSGELQRITKNGSVCEVEIVGGSSGTNSNEIQEESEDSSIAK